MKYPHLRPLMVVLLSCLLAACQPNSVTPFAATLPPTGISASLREAATAVPTANPIASRTPTLPPTATYTPSPTPTVTPTPTATTIPTNTPIPTNTLPPTLTPTPLPTATPVVLASPVAGALEANATVGPTWTPPPADPAVQIADHYHFTRPISQDGANWADRTYPYGGTSGGRLQVHLGVDMENPRGTPILAAADGTVFYAGDDLATQFGPQTDYYGNVVVLQHSLTDSSGQPVYTLYGHMHRVDVQTGQSVKQGQTLGIVGDSGVAFGPHLHFEVRVGNANSWNSTRNPELWIYPYRTFGTLVGRVTNASGAILYDVTLQVKSTDISRYAFSYHDTSVNPDPVFGENFVLGDLPANYYEVSVNDNGRVRFRQIVYVYANRSTWIDVRLN
jgi:murein DD-endopeptidase MepM/ murein hydrolase activator NlpD